MQSCTANSRCLRLCKILSFLGTTSCGDDVDAEYPRCIAAENFVFDLGCQRLEFALFDHRFGNREALKGFDLPARWADHRRVGAPQDVIGPKGVEQVSNQYGISGGVRPHHPRQRAELRIEVFTLAALAWAASSVVAQR